MNLTGNIGRNGAAPPQAWSNPDTDALDARAFGQIEVQIIADPGTPYTPQRSLDGETFVDWTAYDKDLNPVTSIASAGIYTIDGGGYVKLADGAGSSVFVRASA